MTLFQPRARVPFFFGALACIIHFDAFWGPHQWIRIHDHFDGWFVHLKILADLFIKYGIFFWDPTSLTGNQAIASLYTTPLSSCVFIVTCPPLMVFVFHLENSCQFSCWLGALFISQAY